MSVNRRALKITETPPISYCTDMMVSSPKVMLLLALLPATSAVQKLVITITGAKCDTKATAGAFNFDCKKFADPASDSNAGMGFGAGDAGGGSGSSTNVCDGLAWEELNLNEATCTCTAGTVSCWSMIPDIVVLRVDASPPSASLGTHMSLFQNSNYPRDPPCDFICRSTRARVL